MRRGLSFAEIMITLGVIAIPMLATLYLTQSNLHQSALCREQALARQLLLDFSELLLYSPVKELKKHPPQLGEKAAHSQLAALVDLSPFLPGQVTEYFKGMHANFMKTFEMTFEENVGGQTGLARMSLSVEISTGRRIKLLRFFRPQMVQR